MTIELKIQPSALVKRAYEIHGGNQEAFGSALGKNQSQVSKYMRGETSPSAEVIIRCMTIIEERGNEITEISPIRNLMEKVKTLEDEKHKNIRDAIMHIINAYEQNWKTLA